MQINLGAKIFTVLFLFFSQINLNAQMWSKSFTAGEYDLNSKFLGGSEVLHLVNHKSTLYASVGYWQDESNIWYGGSNTNFGWGQINRLDNPTDEWQEDLFLGSNFLRPEILKQIIFTKDQFGNTLLTPDTLLICAGYSPNYLTSNVTVTSFVRNDLNGIWGESLIVQGGFPAGENYSIRDIEMYTDKETGFEYVFATVGTQGIYKGKYNPAKLGKIDWIPAAEFGPLSIRSLGIEIANGSLYFSSGSKLYRRIDGVAPNYVIDHDFSDLGATINSAVGGIRGLTTIYNQSGLNDAFLLMWCPNGQSQGIVYRLEADGSGGFNRIYETKLSLLIENFLIGSNPSYILGAYNEFYQYFDPISNDTVHIVGFEANISGGGHPTWNSYYKGALFAKRDSNGQYSVVEINDNIGLNDTALIASRCYTSSPFENESALYFGGFDPNGFTSTNKAWIYKQEYPIDEIGYIEKDETNFVIYPNPATSYIIVESEICEGIDYQIVNCIGEIVLAGMLNYKIETIDISSLPPNIYHFRTGNKKLKLIKTY